VFVLQGEPSHVPSASDGARAERQAPYKRGWHTHLEEAGYPVSKAHIGLFPEGGRVATDDLTATDAELERVLRMLKIELVDRVEVDG